MRTITPKTKRQQERLASIFPNGVPKKIRCYDNGGKTADRYTVVFTGNYRANTGRQQWYLGLSGAPFHPQGICQHGESDNSIDTPSYAHLGKKVKYETLPEDVKKAIIETYLYLWSFTDEQGNVIV